MLKKKCWKKNTACVIRRGSKFVITYTSVISNSRANSVGGFSLSRRIFTWRSFWSSSGMVSTRYRSIGERSHTCPWLSVMQPSTSRLYNMWSTPSCTCYHMHRWVQPHLSMTVSDSLVPTSSTTGDPHLLSPVIRPVHVHIHVDRPQTHSCNINIQASVYVRTDQTTYEGGGSISL